MSPTVREYARVLRARWRWVAWGAVLSIGCAIAVLLLVPTVYRSTATVFVRTPGDVSLALDGGDSYARQRSQSYIHLAHSVDIAARIVTDLDLDTAPENISERITATTRPDTVLIDVAVDAPVGDDAQQIATVFLAEFAAEVRALESVSGSVLPRAELVVVDRPSVPRRADFGGIPTAALLLGSGSIGALGGASGAALRSLFDRSIRDPGEVRTISRLPVFGRIRSGSRGEADEDARIIRNRIMDSLGHPHGGVIALTEPAGKPVTATAVALTAALKAGNETTVLVDLNHAAPALTEQCGNRSHAGVADVLDGRAALHSAIQDSKYGPVLDLGNSTGKSCVLDDPAALSTIVLGLREEYTWVVVVCPSVNVATAVAGKSGAVALITRLGSTTEDALVEASQQLRDRTSCGVIIESPTGRKLRGPHRTTEGAVAR